jgi:hypothetical protein
VQEPFIVVIDGDGKVLFGVFLANDVLVEIFLNFLGLVDFVECGTRFAGGFAALPNDVMAEVNTIGAYGNSIGAFNEGVGLG